MARMGFTRIFTRPAGFIIIEKHVFLYVTKFRHWDIWCSLGQGLPYLTGISKICGKKVIIYFGLDRIIHKIAFANICKTEI